MDDRLDSVWCVDYRQALDEIPTEIAELLPLFDGRRTLEEVVRDSGLKRGMALEVVRALKKRKLLCAPSDDDSGPELSAWLGQPARRTNEWFRWHRVGFAAGAIVAAAVTARLAHRPRVNPPVAAVTAIAVAAPPPPVVAAPPPPVVAAPPPPVVAAPPPPAPPPPPIAVVAPPPPPPVAAPEPDAHALVEEGLALYKKGRLKQATQKLEEAQKLDAPGALVALARCHLDLGADAKALAEAERATHENPRDAEAWLIVGTVEQQRSRAADAKTAYKKYLELSPRGAFAGEVRAILRSL